MKKLIKKLCLLVVVSVIAVGCTQSTYVYNSGVTRPKATVAKDIQIFSQTTIEKPYQELGSIAVTKTSEEHGEGLKNQMREAAAEMGADAVIAFRFDYDLSGNVQAMGTAIKFK